MAGKWLGPLRNFDQCRGTRYPQRRNLAPLYHPIEHQHKKNERNYRHVNNLNIMMYVEWKRLLISILHVYYSFALLSQCSIGRCFELPYYSWIEPNSRFQSALILYLRFFLPHYKKCREGFVFIAAAATCWDSDTLDTLTVHLPFIWQDNFSPPTWRVNS